MLTQTYKPKLGPALALLCAAIQTTALAATYNANFNNGIPTGMTLYDPAKIVDTGGVANSGYLSLTDAIGSQQGSAIIDDFNNGQPIGGFTAKMKLLIGGGGGTPADGFSFSFGDDISDAAFGEEGTGSRLRVALDTYDNGGGEAPAMDIYWGGNVFAHTKFAGVGTVTTPPIKDPATGGDASLQTGTNFVDFIIDLHPNGTLDVVFKGITVYTNLVIPDYAPVAGRFGLGGRTGGSVENHWVDDVSITTVPPITGAPTVKLPPTALTVNERGSATFSVVPNGAPPFSFQWSKNGVAIQDATLSAYTLTNAAAGDNNAKFRVKITNAAGNVDSVDAILTVIPDTTKPVIVSATASETFTDIYVVFSEELAAASAGNKANYAFDNGLTVSTATLVTPNTVKLTTSKQSPGGVYNLTVNNIADIAATPNTIAPNTVRAVPAFIILKGGLRFKAYFDIAGTPVDNLLQDQKYLDDAADVIGYVTQFTSRLIFPDASHDNYGGTLTGWLVPVETADYEFFLRSDDASRLFLSTDDNPANAVQIAEETSCCNAFLEAGAPQTSSPISLKAGQRYWVQAIYKEGGGGDYVDVAWRKVGTVGDPKFLPYIPGNVLESYGPPGSLTAPTAAITSPVAGASFDPGTAVTITVSAAAATNKTISKVEFFDQTKKLGESTASPFTFVATGLSDDAHVLTVRATDSAGLFVDSAPVSISLGALVQQTILFKIGDQKLWSYDRSGTDLGTAWKEPKFDDTKWPKGRTLIADESTTTVEPILTPISRFDDNGVHITTFYYRTHFNWTGSTKGVKLKLRHAVDDGAVFYLNGVEVSRFGLAAGNTFDFSTFFSDHENAYEGPFDISNASLVTGDNVFAVEVHQASSGSSDTVFGAELIATVNVVPAVTTLFAIDDKSTFRYDRSGTDLGTAWSAKAFDDSKWPQGKMLIADESTTTVEPIRTPISRFDDNGVHITTFYYRTHFNLDVDPGSVQKLRLRHVVDDGAVFYINGAEVLRFGLAAGTPFDFSTFFGDHENAYEGPIDLVTTNLVKGDNVFAAEVHQTSAGSSDTVFGAELKITVLVPADSGGSTTPPTLSIARSGTSLTISWTEGGTLQSASSIKGPWADVSSTSPQVITTSGAAKFYRVSR